jgi:hypothetical protein
MSVTFSGLGTQGRLGNSVFQMAAVIGLARKHNDTFIFPKWQYQNDFNIPANHFVDHVTYSNVFRENNFTYQHIPYQPNLNLEGFFQSNKYFDHCKNDILNLFAMKEQLPIEANSIHIRRGDYQTLGNSYYIDLAATNYYEKATDIIGQNENYMVFSDDPNWCRRKFFNRSNIIIVDNGGDVIKDFNMMTRCTNNIIANSSFSWWGAYLNRNPNKKVIAPQAWFGPRLPHDTRDLLPPEWTRII